MVIFYSYVKNYQRVDDAWLVYYHLNITQWIQVVKCLQALLVGI